MTFKQFVLARQHIAEERVGPAARSVRTNEDAADAELTAHLKRLGG